MPAVLHALYEQAIYDAESEREDRSNTSKTDRFSHYVDERVTRVEVTREDVPNVEQKHQH